LNKIHQRDLFTYKVYSIFLALSSKSNTIQGLVKVVFLSLACGASQAQQHNFYKALYTSACSLWGSAFHAIMKAVFFRGEGGGMRVPSRTARLWLLLALLPLATGAALVVHILSRVSLGLSLLVGFALVSVTGVLAWRRLRIDARREMARRAVAGLVAGLLGTLAYDLVRLVVVKVFHYTFWPFDIFSLFGLAIVGPGLPPLLTTAVGVIYHYMNGILFAIAYAILLAPRGWWSGILWALGLEACMLALYPGWLHIQAYNEFVSVSMIGHLAYGTTIGIVSKLGLMYEKRCKERISPVRF
jgi:hypothetical protein